MMMRISSGNSWYQILNESQVSLPSVSWLCTIPRNQIKDVTHKRNLPKSYLSESNQELVHLLTVWYHRGASIYHFLHLWHLWLLNGCYMRKKYLLYICQSESQLCVHYCFNSTLTDQDINSPRCLYYSCIRYTVIIRYSFQEKCLLQQQITLHPNIGPDLRHTSRTPCSCCHHVTKMSQLSWRS